MAYLGEPKQAVEQFVGKEYIQHNPDVANGTQGFIDYFERMQREYPDKSIEFVRSIAEGDLVALHTLQTWPGNDQYVTMDFLGLIKTEKSASIGIAFNKCRKTQQTTMAWFSK